MCLVNNNKKNEELKGFRQWMDYTTEHDLWMQTFINKEILQEMVNQYNLRQDKE